MEQIQVIKIGGNIINRKNLLRLFLKDFSAISGKKILIHGGGKIANKIGKKMNLKPNVIKGRRITDAKTLELVTMVYSGLINKNIVALLQKNSCNAIGLSGMDNNILVAHKRKITEDINYGFVGDIDIDKQITSNLELFISQNMVPVICSITHDGNGNLLNTNADTIASTISILLAKKFKVQLIYCFDKNGVLAKVNGEVKTIKTLNFNQFDDFKKTKYISDGMIPKLDNAFNSLQLGVNSIVIKHAKDLLNPKAGTHIIKG